MSLSKVGNWAAMAAQKQKAAAAPRPNTLNGVRLSASHNPKAVAASKMATLGRVDTQMVNKPVVMPSTTPQQKRPRATPAKRETPVTLDRKRQPPTVRKTRRPIHDEDNAHLFNSAGVIMPSISGVDSVTERLFDQGEIMSLGPSRSQHGYYPDGGPVGGSFLLDQTSEKKRKRNDEC